MADPTPENSDNTSAAMPAGPMGTAQLPISPVGPTVEKPVDTPPDSIALLCAKLPTYARGLLKIRVPVHVTLASQRKPIQEIIELGPGSIVKFEKTCDESLELAVGDRPIAEGEVVKVGDKFGLRVGRLISQL